MMMMTVNDIRKELLEKRQKGEITPDPQGRKGEEYQIIEILGASFIADEPAIFGKPNMSYIKDEIAWYLGQSTNINSIYRNERPPPKAWVESADKHGEINSNYGRLIFSSLYYDQFRNAVNSLKFNPTSRRATMIYNRPSIWYESTENGKNDFICTNAVTYYIRDNKIHCVVQMRSNDVIFGYRNDYAWQEFVLDKVCENLHGEYKQGNIYWQVQNLHIYGRHFHYLDNYHERQ